MWSMLPLLISLVSLSFHALVPSIAFYALTVSIVMPTCGFGLIEQPDGIVFSWNHSGLGVCAIFSNKPLESILLSKF